MLLSPSLLSLLLFLSYFRPLQFFSLLLLSLSFSLSSSPPKILTVPKHPDFPFVYLLLQNLLSLIFSQHLFSCCEPAHNTFPHVLLLLCYWGFLPHLQHLILLYCFFLVFQLFSPQQPLSHPLSVPSVPENPSAFCSIPLSWRMPHCCPAPPHPAHSSPVSICGCFFLFFAAPATPRTRSFSRRCIRSPSPDIPSAVPCHMCGSCPQTKVESCVSSSIRPDLRPSHSLWFSQNRDTFCFFRCGCKCRPAIVHGRVLPLRARKPPQDLRPFRPLWHPASEVPFGSRPLPPPV